LGAGGMGEVYLAERLRRLQREAKALAALDHPNIVTVFSVEEDKGVNFLTMAHVEGQGLDELIPSEGFEVEQLLDYAIPLADALRAAHEHGIVHRDLKPANLMIDKEDRLRVLDFGLARREVAAGPDDETQLASLTMTQAGTVLGTYPYMSPEQAQGQVADARSDLFSLGIILYEMATGRRPFSGETGVSLISSILKDTPMPVTDVKEGLPAELGAIIERCLEKNPTDRYQIALEVREALAELRRRVRAGRAGGVSRPRRLALAAVTLVTVLTGVSSWLVWTWEEPSSEVLASPQAGPQIASLAVLPLRNLSGDPEQEYFADGMTEALITDLSKIGALRVISRTSVMRYKDTDKSLSEIAEELDVDAVIEGSVLREGNRVGITAQLIEAATETNLWADRYEREIESILTLQGEMARAIAGEIEVTLTPGEEALLTRKREVDPEAYESYLKGQAQWQKLTPAGLDAAEAYFEAALEKDPDYAQAHAGMAIVWAVRQQMGVVAPSEAGPKTKAAALRALEIDDSLAEAHQALAVVRAWTDWDWDAAEASFRRAIELNPNLAEVRAFYAHYLAIMRRPDEAMAQMQRALELDPYNALFPLFKGVVLESTGGCEEALAFYSGVLERIPTDVSALEGMIRVNYCLKRYEESYKAALAKWTAQGRPDAVAALEAGYAEGGFQGAMSGLADWKQEHLRYCDDVNLAAGGRAEEALDCLESRVEQHDPNMPYIGVFATDPALKDEPRFQELLRRMNLPASESSPTGSV
jgi:serine/threonine protein kinase/Tfp pilus assembly protein PilF